jgi:hypothetical protein
MRMTTPTAPTPPVLSLDQLAELLQVSLETAGAIALHHTLPHVTIGGEPRFVTAQVLGWLQHMASPAGGELLPTPPTPEPVVRTPPPIVAHAMPARAVNDHPWVDADITSALAEGSADAGRNLDRLKIRDALLELNDALLPRISRLSEGRMHPDPNERSRTSPWRLDLDADGAITAMSIAWGAGNSGAPQFTDRPRLQAELTHGLLRIAFEPEGRTCEISMSELAALENAGLVVDAAPGTEGHLRVNGVARVYTLPPEGVALSVVGDMLGNDIEHLVPLWSRCV